MGPIRGFKRRKKEEKKVDQNHVLTAAATATAVSSSQPQPQQSSDWWDDFLKRITGFWNLWQNFRSWVRSSSPQEDGVLVEERSYNGSYLHLFMRTSGSLAESRNSNKFESLFKISRKTFDYICSLVEGDLRARQSSFSDSNGIRLSPTDQVAVALRRLGSGESLANVGKSLRINQSTVSEITWRFVEVMEERGLHHLHWPSTQAEMEEIKSKFEKIRGLPNCCGAIDTTHIVMTLPTVDQSNDVWIDREKKHSMVLQAIVDPDMRFLDVIVGYPGSLSDALVLQNSSFFKLSEEGKRLNGRKIVIQEGKKLREYIVGNAGYPLLPWLLTPYQHELPDHQAEFNQRHSATQVVAQIALARLKEMWRIIHGVMWLPDKNKLPRIIFVCCLLHNIVIDMEDKVFNQMPSSHKHNQGYRQQICESVTETGIVMRDNLSLYFSGKLQPSIPSS